ncbi:MAG TPA: ABC transporter substrate-binding protein [Candidatus Binatia bacterium]|nr:ABC transporter substrate-binding protein [Candidatus Binatia bacterium]
MFKLRTGLVLRVIAPLLIFLWSVSAPAEEVSVSYATFTASYMDHLVAFERGYFTEEGLTLNRITVGGGIATQTLVANKLDFSSSGSSAMSAAIRGGPVKVVYTNLSRPAYKLVTNKPEIRTMQDLIGRKIAINTHGDTGHLATLLLLKKHHINPKSVLFIAVRSNDAKLPAFLAGAVDAAPLTAGEITKIGPDKGRIFADFRTEIQMVYTGVAVSNRFLAERPMTVERFMRGLAKGREFARRFKEPTIAIMAKRNPLPVEALSLDYDIALGSMTDEGWISDETLNEEVKTRAELVNATKVPDVGTIFDYTLIKKAYTDLKKERWTPTR